MFKIVCSSLFFAVARVVSMCMVVLFELLLLLLGKHLFDSVSRAFSSSSSSVSSCCCCSCCCCFSSSSLFSLLLFSSFLLFSSSSSSSISGALWLVLLLFFWCSFLFGLGSHSERRCGGHKTARLIFKLSSKGQKFKQILTLKSSDLRWKIAPKHYKTRGSK